MAINRLIVANLKNSMTISDVRKYLNIVNNSIESKNVVICPSNIYIPYFINQKYSIGIQNIDYENCTGSISPKQVRSVGIQYAIIGHSERRNNFKENYLTINKKLSSAINSKIVPILCIGETEIDKEMLKTNLVLKRQIRDELNNIDISNIIIAYEPVWSIGTNKIPSINEIEKTISYIKFTVNNLYNKDVRVLYGGSIDENNISEINKIKDIDGFLIGSSSSNPKKFLNIIEVVGSQ